MLFCLCAHVCAWVCRGKRKNCPVIFHSATQSARQTYCQLRIIKTAPNNSRDRFKKKRQNVAVQVFAYLSLLQWQICCILIQSPTKIHPLPHLGLSRKCLWSFLSVGEGATGGTRGWVADWRQAVISLPAWHLPTAANPLLISSRPCAWQQRGFQISFSPWVKNPKPYHFVNGYL